MRAVLFDLDGTLADTLGDIADALNFVLAGHGFGERPLAEIRDFVGEGARRLVERSLPEEARARTDELLAAFRTRYYAHLIVKSTPYPGIPELLDELSARGVPMGVVSNKPDAPTQTLVARMFARWRFAYVAGEIEGIPRKPDAAPLLAAARALGRAPDTCLFVGDTRIDIDAARAAGMVPVGVVWGFRGHEELTAAGARALLHAPGDLLPLVDR